MEFKFGKHLLQRVSVALSPVQKSHSAIAHAESYRGMQPSVYTVF